jgi:hypothetical protein
MAMGGKTVGKTALLIGEAAAPAAAAAAAAVLWGRRRAPATVV